MAVCALGRRVVANGLVAVYTYGPFGRRLTKSTYDAQGASTTRRYAYDGAVICEIYDDAGQWVAEIIAGAGDRATSVL